MLVSAWWGLAGLRKFADDVSRRRGNLLENLRRTFQSDHNIHLLVRRLGWIKLSVFSSSLARFLRSPLITFLTVKFCYLTQPNGVVKVKFCWFSFFAGGLSVRLISISPQSSVPTRICVCGASGVRGVALAHILHYPLAVEWIRFFFYYCRNDQFFFLTPPPPAIHEVFPLPAIIFENRLRI